MAAERAGHVASEMETALTPVREETESELAKASAVRSNKSNGRGGSLSSGTKRRAAAINGRLLPFAVRRSKAGPPSSVKRMKSKEAAVVAAVPMKPKLPNKQFSSGSKTPPEEALQPTNEESTTERSDVAIAQKTKVKTKLSKAERVLKKAEAAVKAAEAQVQAEKISIKKSSKVKDERARQARERDAKTLKVSPQLIDN